MVGDGELFGVEHDFLAGLAHREGRPAGKYRMEGRAIEELGLPIPKGIADVVIRLGGGQRLRRPERI